MIKFIIARPRNEGVAILSGAKASLKPNGQTKQIGAHPAAGYDVEISMQSAMGGSKDMAMTVTLSGPFWM